MTPIELNVERSRTGRPKVTTTSEVIDLWAERLRANTQAQLAQCEPHFDKDSISFSGDEIRHYGHFTLARIVRRQSGRIVLVLLNGDSYAGGGGWGPSTSSRQADVRRAVTNVGVPYIILPLSTLTAAGIIESSVTPIHVRPDRNTHHDVIVSERPGRHVKIEDPSGATEMVAETHHGYHVGGEPARHDAEGATYGAYTVQVERPVMVDDPNFAHVDRRPAHGWVRDYAVLQPDGRWKYTVERHWLGDSLFKAKVRDSRSRKLTEDEQAKWDEFQAAEQAVRSAEDAYRASFDPERPGYDETLWAEASAARERTANLRYELPSGIGRGRIHFTVDRWAMFLSSFDYNEPHMPYFMCELPRGCKAETVEQAIDALMPEDVRAAIDSGLDVLRQGDVFAIPTAYTTSELESRAKLAGHTRRSWDEQGVHTDTYKREAIRRFKAEGSWDANALDIHGTNHRATALIVTKDGEQYGRGRMYHVPRESWRTAEHRVLTLGDGETWYRMVKNTVPLDKATGSSRGSTPGGNVFQSGQSRAWTLGGMVD